MSKLHSLIYLQLLTLAFSMRSTQFSEGLRACPQLCLYHKGIQRILHKRQVMCVGWISRCERGHIGRELKHAAAAHN